MLDRAQTYQQKQGGDTAKPLTGNYRDGFHAHTYLHKLSLSTLNKNVLNSSRPRPAFEQTRKQCEHLKTQSENSREMLPEIKPIQLACV